MRIHAPRQDGKSAPGSSSATAHAGTPTAALHRDGDRAGQAQASPAAEHRFNHVPSIAVPAAAASAIQRKAIVSAPGDRYEREADAAAERVMSMPGARLAAPDGDARPSITTRSGAAPLQAMSSAMGEAGPGLDAAMAERAAGGAGRPLPAEERSFFEPRFGYDFSNVRVHAGAEAAEAARSVRARAYTLGSSIVFGAGQYAPGSSEGRRLMAHELAHVVQQRGAAAGVVQRSAVATWTDATDADRRYFLSTRDQKSYLAQQERIAKGKTVKEPIALPNVEKIMVVSANYHHYASYPTPEGGVLAFDATVIDEAKRQFRVGGSPDFWPNIKWRANDGSIREIGVRFDINFIPHATEPDATAVENYGASRLYGDPNVKARPQDNVFVMQDIDRISKMGLGLSSIIALAERLNINNFALEDDDQTVVYTPTNGGAPVRYRAYEDSLTIIKLVREEAKARGIEADIGNDVLGYASEGRVTLDINKTAPASKTYHPYEAKEDVNDYKDYERKALEKTTTVTMTPEERKKRAGAVVAHEIGHNIGMGHTDLGIMNESTETETKVRTGTQLNDPTSMSSTVYSSSTRLYAITFESHTEAMAHENIQLLANRLQAMTDYVLPVMAANTGGQKPSLQEFWTGPIDTLRTLLAADDFATILGNDLQASMLAIPYEPSQLDALITRGTFVARDKTVIRAAMAATGRLVAADWANISSGARTFIKAETLRLIGQSFSGVTFFESQAQRDAY